MATTRRSKDEWRELVDEWRLSGLSRREFACDAGVNANTLAWWRWKLEVAEVEPPAFLEVVIAEAEPPPDFEVLVGDVVVRVPLGFDAHELRRLMNALC